MFDFVYDSARNVNPFTPVVDLRARFDGFENGAGRRFDGFGVLNDVRCCEAKIQRPAIEKSRGVRVAVKDARPFEFVVRGDIDAVVPVKEVELDVFAIFVMADFAFAGVAVERRWIGGVCELRLFCGHLFRA